MKSRDCVQTNLISSPPATYPRFPTRPFPPPPGPPPRSPLVLFLPSIFCRCERQSPTNTARLSLIPSRYAAEVEIYCPFFCYPEHKSCIRIKVISPSSLSNFFFPTPDSTDICRNISQTDNNNSYYYYIRPTRPQTFR